MIHPIHAHQWSRSYPLWCVEQHPQREVLIKQFPIACTLQVVYVGADLSGATSVRADGEEILQPAEVGGVEVAANRNRHAHHVDGKHDTEGAGWTFGRRRSKDGKKRRTGNTLCDATSNC